MALYVDIGLHFKRFLPFTINGVNSLISVPSVTDGHVNTGYVLVVWRILCGIEQFKASAHNRDFN